MVSFDTMAARFWFGSNPLLGADPSRAATRSGIHFENLFGFGLFRARVKQAQNELRLAGGVLFQPFYLPHTFVDERR